MTPNDSNTQSFAQKYGIKLRFIGIISVILIIASSTIWLLAYDREKTSEEVNREVASLWGGPVTIQAPRIIIGNYKCKSTKSPASVDFNATLENEQLNRNIYTTNVYKATVTVSGTFAAIKPTDRINATFIVPVHADKIIESGELTLGDKKYPLKSDYGKLTAEIDPRALAGSETEFSLTFKLRGSKRIDFVPVAAKNTVTISGNCPMPSFKGVELPVERTVSDNGFSAKWVNLNTSLIPESEYLYDDTDYILPPVPCQVPLDETYDMGADTLPPITEVSPDDLLDVSDRVDQSWEDHNGIEVDSDIWMYFQGNCEVEFVTGVDSYRKVVRAIKFAYLIILLTFIAVFATEILSRRNIPLVNYFLIGAALVVFYTLLLSMAELIGFDLGFLIGAIMTVGLITLYLRTSVGSSRLAAFNGLFLSIIYGCCYVMICMGALALLIGSLMIFLAIAASMYVSVKFYKN